MRSGVGPASIHGARRATTLAMAGAALAAPAQAADDPRPNQAHGRFTEHLSETRTFTPGRTRASA